MLKRFANTLCLVFINTRPQNGCTCKAFYGKRRSKLKPRVIDLYSALWGAGVRHRRQASRTPCLRRNQIKASQIPCLRRNRRKASQTPCLRRNRMKASQTPCLRRQQIRNNLRIPLKTPNLESFHHWRRKKLLLHLSIVV